MRVAGCGRALAGAATAAIVIVIGGTGCATSHVPMGTAGVGWRGDFESGDLSQWDSEQAKPDRITLVRHPVRQGRLAARFEVRDGDRVTKHGERAELVKVTKEHTGDESWWAWSVYFPKKRFRIAPNHRVVFTQWHDSPPYAGKPPTLFYVLDRKGRDTLRVDVRGGNAVHPQARTFRLGPLERNHWYDFVFHVRWDPVNGFVQLWLDGRRVVSMRGPTIYRGKFLYLKQGNYRHPYRKTSVLFEDGTRRAATRAGL